MRRRIPAIYPDLGGLAGRMPFVAVAMLIAGSGFAGTARPERVRGSELLVFLGAYRRLRLAHGAGGAWHCPSRRIHILWMMERAFFGAPRERFADLTDASLVEAAPACLNGYLHHRRGGLSRAADRRVRFGPGTHDPRP